MGNQLPKPISNLFSSSLSQYQVNKQDFSNKAENSSKNVSCFSQSPSKRTNEIAIKMQSSKKLMKSPGRMSSRSQSKHVKTSSRLISKVQRKIKFESKNTLSDNATLYNDGISK
jgi:hypothetical protein